MEGYLMIKVNSEEEYQKYNYLFQKFSITVIRWEVDEDIAEQLYKEVSLYSDWKLFILDFSTVYADSKLYLQRNKQLLETLSQNDFYCHGRGQCKPPEKIYIFTRKWEDEREIGESIFKDIWSNIPIYQGCRFLIMDCSKTTYLKEYEDLKVVSMIILLKENDMPPEIMEAYSIYHVNLQIHNAKLYAFLKQEEKLLKQEEYQLRRKRYEIENIENSKIKEGMDYIPSLSVDKYEELRIRKGFCCIKTEKGELRWEQEKRNLSIKMNLLKKEQVRKQKSLSREVRERAKSISMDHLCLENHEIEKIQNRIKQIQKDLNQHYITLWEVNEEFQEEKEKSEQALDDVLQKRYSWKELLIVILGSMFFLIVLFGLCLYTEIKVIEDNLQNGLSMEIFLKENLCFIKNYIIIFACVLFGYIVVASCLEINEKYKKFNTTLGNVDDKLRENLSHYRDFFSMVCQLQVNQSYLIRNQAFKLYRKNEKEKIEQMEKIFQEKKECFIAFYEIFKHLETENEDMELQEGTFFDIELYINQYDKKITNPLYYIENLIITKEVRDEY